MKKLLLVIFTMCMIIGVLSSQVTDFPFTEGFEGALFPPIGWTVLGGDDAGGNWAREAFSQISGDASAMSYNYTMFGGLVNPDNYLVAPALVIPEGAGAELNWKENRVNANQTYSILISTTTPTIAAFEEIWTGTSTLQGPDFYSGNLDLTEYAGETIYLAFRHHSSTNAPMFGMAALVLDDIEVSLIVDHDLVAQSISGPANGQMDTAVDFTINVSNNGLFPASNYTVKLMSEGEYMDIELDSIQGITLGVGENHDFVLSWTPDTIGNYALFGYVDYPDDLSQGNNKSPIHDFMVSPASIVSVYVGNQNAGFLVQGPYQMNQMSTLHQTIYLESQLQGASGLLTHVTYRFRGHGDVAPDNIYRLYVGTTELNDFGEFEEGTNGPWIPLSNFTMVHENELPLSAPGERDVNIVFDTPFSYTGGNIVIMTQRGEVDWGPQFNIANVWQTTPVSGNTPSIGYGGGFVANPASPGAHYATAHPRRPNITFHFLTGDTGTLQGQVTYNGEPLEDVEILLNGTPRKVYTDFEGNFTMTHVPEGSVSITVSRFMYVTQVIDINIIPDEINTINIEMQVVSHDFHAVSLTGPNMPSENQPANYLLTVRNDGGVPAIDYEVRLMQVVNQGDDIVLDSTMGVFLPSNGIHTFILQWTPPSQDIVQVYGHVIYDLCPNIENHSTNTITVTPQPFGTAIAYIGDTNSTHYQNNPHVAFNLPTSISQQIYRPEEISLNGAITEITYRFRAAGDIPGPAWVKFYATITDMDEFPRDIDNDFVSSAWYPYDEMTLIFDGYIDVTGYGEKDIVLQLIEPFPYYGGNLLIASYSPIDYARWYSMANSWQQTTFTGQNKSIRNIDFDHIDFDNLFPGFVTEYIPNTKFTFQTAGLGGLSGVVTHNALPISGAEISVEGSNIRRITGDDGTFDFPFLPVGFVTIHVKAQGFQDIERHVSIIEDETVEENISMTPRPTVNVSGTVIASDTGVGLAGGLISLTGYADYEQIYTNAQGQFTIPAVFANMDYILSISRDGYITHTQSLEVGVTDLTIPAITLIERPLRPRNVIATSTDSEVLLSWEAPGENEIRISQGVQDWGIDGIGTGSVIDFSVAHRFTQAQLSALGVQNGDLTRVSIFIGERYATYTIKVWTGGSDNPLNAGTLIYEGPEIPGTDITMYRWNDFDLFAPIAIPAEGELWIGYQIKAQTGFPAGIDEGPENNGFGNLLFIEGEWNTLYGINPNFYANNFMIRGYVTSAEGLGNRRNSVILSASESQEISPASTKSITPSWQNANKTPIIRGSNGEWNTFMNTMSDSSSSILVETKDDRAFENYRIFRVPLNSMFDESTWIPIADGITGYNYTDGTWNEIPTGEFKYVVQSVYTNDNVSNPAFSNTIWKNMLSMMDLVINTYDSGVVNGAVVRLVNNNGNPEHIYQQTATQNRVVFPQVWHGNYTLSVELQGYQRIERRNLNIFDTFNYEVSLQATFTMFKENFDTGGFPPTDWSLIDADGDGHNWLLLTDFPGESHTPPYFAVSFTNNGYEIMSPDNFLVMHPLDLPENSDVNLQYYITTASPDYPRETYSVVVSNSPSIVSGFVTIFTETLTAANANWQVRNIDLSDYAGQRVYVAFRHFNSYNNNAIGLDTIELTYGDRVLDDRENVTLPTLNALKGNYPNPFNPTTTIAFDIALPGNVRIDIFNIRGQRVKTVSNEHFGAGSHRVEWNGTDENDRSVGSGIYFYRMVSGDFTDVKRMVLLK
ncbi:MAG: choice-of-anchor J domain-containing protein [Candidatus Cloacimonetes bacterium]|nr:choice-of-anchor J domain-containing protein [Candidatus Cloacimonadota bacterium]